MTTNAAPPEPTRESDLDETKSYLEYLLSSGRSVPIRSLIGYWGYKGRGKNTIQTISGDLDRMGLRTSPPFDGGPLDAEVKIARTLQDAVTLAASERPADHLLTLSRINSAMFALRLEDEGSVRGFVTRDTSIADAVTLMMRHDFSQLPVVDSYDRPTVSGIFTWETFGQAQLRGPATKVVGDALAPTAPVDLHSDLFASVAPVTDRGYVVVTYRGELSGIVTASDLTLEFEDLALPFLAVGRCERELKRVARGLLAEPLAVTSKPLDDFTFGNLQHLFADNWGLLRWSLSKSEFIDWLDATRRLRNLIAHFDDPDEDLSAGIDAVHRLTRWLSGIQTAEVPEAETVTHKASS
jgi:CBS domain-containing protein